MSLETALRSIDFLNEHSGRSCIVTFFGGEPLLEFQMIKDIVAYSSRTYGSKVGFRMSTNGTLINRDILKFLKDHDIFFVLSIDGNKQQHDTSRRSARGEGSYDRVACHIGDILEFNPYTIAVSVIVPETVEYLSAGVQDLFKRGFRYVLQTLDYSAKWEKKHIRGLKRQYTELSGYYYKALLEGRKIYYSPFDERIKTWAQKPYGKGDLCDLANTQIAIAASGRIYPCVQFIGTDDEEFRENAIGDVFGGFDSARRLYYVEQNYEDKDTCTGCALNGRCATNCGCVNWRSTGHLNRIPPIICEHERMLMPIVDRLANKLWRKNISLFKRKFYEKTFPMSSYIEDCVIKRREEFHAED